MRKDLTGPSSAPGWREEVVMAQRCCYHVGVLPAGDVCTRGRCWRIWFIYLIFAFQASNSHPKS